MLPTIRPGQSVLVDPRAYRTAEPRVGDVVLLRHPIQTDLLTVKRLASVRDDQLFVVGDNPDASTDSRSYGSVPVALVLGRVECTFP